MKNPRLFFSKIEKYKAPSTILFRSIELKLLKEKFNQYLKVQLILDLGCGRGIAALAVFDKTIDYGLDNNPSALNQAKKEKIYKKTIFADGKKIPLKDKSINLVFSNCVIEHIENIDSLFKEINRVLKKDGLLIFTSLTDQFKNYSLFSRLNLNLLAKIYGKLRNKKYNHYHAYPTNKWKKILNKSGLKVIDYYYYIDQKTAEYWDLILILSFLLKPLEIIAPSLTWAIYKILFKRRIYSLFLKSQSTNSKGAGICILAKKNKNK